MFDLQFFDKKCLRYDSHDLAIQNKFCVHMHRESIFALLPHRDFDRSALQQELQQLLRVQNLSEHRQHNETFCAKFGSISQHPQFATTEKAVVQQFALCATSVCML